MTTTTQASGSASGRVDRRREVRRQLSVERVQHLGPREGDPPHALHGLVPHVGADSFIVNLP